MSAPASPQRRILVVDDEPFVCDAVKMMLTFDGHIVETASNGKEALAMFEVGKFDLVITDVVMPEMNGRVLGEKLNTLNPDSKILFLSGYTEDTLSTYGVSGSRPDFLEKPFTLNALSTKVKTILS